MVALAPSNKKILLAASLLFEPGAKGIVMCAVAETIDNPNQIQKTRELSHRASRWVRVERDFFIDRRRKIQ
jgi:hypothetical protein